MESEPEIARWAEAALHDFARGYGPKYGRSWMPGVRIPEAKIDSAVPRSRHGRCGYKAARRDRPSDRLMPSGSLFAALHDL